ncbi:nucleotide sugar dehydrogenase, partial [Alphaproteobacteria bacterium]|nr:nucleotide sugar dehydrogenase [Alphaproteobacteria bacterium]
MKKKIAIIGLGYVGLPLALEFAKKYIVVGLDTDKRKIDLCKNKYKIKNISFHTSSLSISECNIFIVAVPTPIFVNKKPDLTFIKKACITVSKYLKKEDLVIFESTVYPGLTEDYCVKLIEKKSNLLLNKDFYVGYSPERINPGDKKHTIEKIIKVTSGSNNKAAKIVDKLYKSIIEAGTYKAPSIKIAEASKVIENTQRDLNIAFVNELKIIFDKMDLDINEILKA